MAVTPSVLDRLLDSGPNGDRDLTTSRVEGVERFRNAVRRDLEQLLNSRNTFDAALVPEFAEAGQSVLTSGLADFSRYNFLSPLDRDRVRTLIERSIRQFEPRLTDVTITMGVVASTDRALRLHLDARLRLDPEPVPVSFDIVLPQQSSSAYEVKERA